MFGVIPLLIIILVIYNGIALIAGPDTSIVLNKVVFNKIMKSGGTFTLEVEEILIIIALFLLFFEIFKSTRASDTSILEHFLSLLVFLTFLLEFIFWDKLTCASFLIVGLMSLLDVVAGFTISITAARRDIGVQT
jgi:hypothetical protein